RCRWLHSTHPAFRSIRCAGQTWGRAGCQANRYIHHRLCGYRFSWTNRGWEIWRTARNRVEVDSRPARLWLDLRRVITGVEIQVKVEQFFAPHGFGAFVAESEFLEKLEGGFAFDEGVQGDFQVT